MGDRTFGMLCAHIGMTGLPMGDGFLEMRDPFIHMGILPGRLGMFECFLSVLHQGICMALFPMRHGFFGMCQGFTRVLVGGSKGEPAEKRDANKRRNGRNDQDSAMGSLFHGLPSFGG